jgi:two-component system cell cycle sensor histidine kinase/response regulator CckA
MNVTNKRVLLVEDERHIRLLVGSILRQKGYTTVEATNGYEALNALRDEPAFDFIITDLQMPELSGVALLRALRAHYPHLPIIVISAYAATDWAKEAIENAVIALPKPFSHAQLVNVVESIA